MKICQAKFSAQLLHEIQPWTGADVSRHLSSIQKEAEPVFIDCHHSAVYYVDCIQYLAHSWNTSTKIGLFVGLAFLPSRKAANTSGRKYMYTRCRLSDPSPVPAALRFVGTDPVPDHSDNLGLD